jgi:hypothetical protein
METFVLISIQLKRFMARDCSLRYYWTNQIAEENRWTQNTAYRCPPAPKKSPKIQIYCLMLQVSISQLITYFSLLLLHLNEQTQNEEQ